MNNTMGKCLGILALVLVFASASLADGNGKGSGQDNSPNNGVTNSGTDNGKGNGGVDNGNKGHKGTGGTGGQGGSGGQGGQGGDATNGPITVTNDNLNLVSLNSVNKSTSKSSSEANSKSTAVSGSTSTSSATGGNASATGGTATAANNSSGNSTSVNEVTNVPRNTASAIAPETFPTVPCFKSYSGAGQAAGFGFSIGGGKIDAGCTAREEARLFAAMGSKVAACKILVGTKAAKDAKVTMEDCLGSK